MRLYLLVSFPLGEVLGAEFMSRESVRAFNRAARKLDDPVRFIPA